MSHHNAKNAQNNPPPDLRRDRRAEESTKRHVYVEPGVKIDLVEDLRKEYDASQRKSATHNEKQLFWTKVAAGLLTLTALFAFWQAYFANRTAKIALIDQRPFLVVKNPGSLPPKLAPNVQLHGSVRIANIGRTPAIDAYPIVKLSYFPQPKPGPPGEYIVQAEKNFVDREFVKLAANEKQARTILRPLEAEQDVAPNAVFSLEMLEDSPLHNLNSMTLQA